MPSLSRKTPQIDHLKSTNFLQITTPISTSITKNTKQSSPQTTNNLPHPITKSPHNRRIFCW